MNFLQLLHDDPKLSHKYDFADLIGEGCFGKIYKVYNKKLQLFSALKVEKFNKTKMKMVLKNEINLLLKLQGKKGVPKVYECGEWSGGLYVEMELLQNDLSQKQSFTLSEISELTVEMIKILESVHSANIVHQDIKPHNIMVSNNRYFLIDFGLSKNLSLQRNLMKGFIGTPRYASINAHNFQDQGKKDDLESLLYNMAYLYYKKLPWSKLSVSNDKKLEKIKLLKVQYADDLFDQMGHPFKKAFEYIISLETLQQPNYKLIRDYFKKNKTINKVAYELVEHEIKKKEKKLSLNPTNFLQVPEVNQYGRITPNKKKSSADTSSRRSSINSNSFQSSMAQLSFQNISTDSPQENYCIEDNIQPILPDLRKYTQPLLMKNPFN